MKLLPMKPMLAIGAALLLAGCASDSNEIKAAYISPMMYDSYSCQQLMQENLRLQSQISSTGGAVDKKAHGDAVKMGVGLVLFWPTLFFLKGDGAEAQEYAQLKGKHAALDEAYTQKHCTSTLAAGAAPPSAAPLPVSSYQGDAATAAKAELAKYDCFDKFSMVSESSGRGVYEATCKSGKRQLMECWSGICKALN